MLFYVMRNSANEWKKENGFLNDIDILRISQAEIKICKCKQNAP